MTANGVVVAAGGALALTAGFGWGYPAGFAVGFVCLALLIVGLPVRPLPGRAVRLDLTVEPATVERGSPVTVTVAATGPGMAHLRAGPERAELAVGGREPARWQSPPLPRGRHLVAVDRVVAVGPLALWRRGLPFTGGRAEIAVHPRHVDLADPPDLIDLDEENRPARIGVGTGAAFAGLREYEPGDDLRHIDWAASARSSGDLLYVRQFAPALAEDRVVVLDPGRPGAARPEAFELAIDLAYSFVLAGADLAIDGEPDPVRGAAAARDVLIGLTARASTPAPAPTRPGGVVAVVTAWPEHADELRWSYGSEVLIFGVCDRNAAPAGVVPVTDLASAADAWARMAAR